MARFFWDLYDSTEENESGSGSCSGSCDDCNGGFDNQNYTLSKLINDWDDFQAGSCNRRASETGVDGRNVWDYQHYKPWACSEIHLNCLDDQYEGGPCCGC